MKRFIAVCAAVILILSAFVGTAGVFAAVNGIDFLRESTVSCGGATAVLRDGSLVITATAKDQEVALVVKQAANLNVYPQWEGTVTSTVPFDIVYQDKTYNKWIYASANFCYAYENNNGASKPLPAGTHDVSYLISDVYTWNNGTLPADASICSITFIAREPGTITVSRCAMTNGSSFAKAYPDVVYQQDGNMIKAIPLSHTVSAFCNNARRRFDTVKTTVKKSKRYHR